MKTKQQLADEIKALQAQHDAMPEVLGINYKPKMRERYWWIDGNGAKLEEYWADDNMDNARIARGNCYPTQEAAERIVRNRMTLIKLREFAFEPDWNDIWQEKYYFSLNKGKLHRGMATDYNSGSPVYFTTPELRTQAQEAVGENVIIDMLVGGLV